MSLVTSGKLLPADIVEQIVTLDAKKLRERPFGPLVILIQAPVDDEGAHFVAALERSMQLGRRAPVDSGALLTTAEFPTLGVEPNEPSEADQVELLAAIGSATHFIVPLLTSPGRCGLTLGRSSSVNIQLNDASVSSQHIELTLEDGGARIADLGSKNGTFLNGERLEPSTSHWLQPMDRLSLGRISAFACDPRALRAVLRQDLKTLL